MKQPPIETQIKTLIQVWQEQSPNRPVERDWVHANLKSDEISLQEVSDFITDNFQNK